MCFTFTNGADKFQACCDASSRDQFAASTVDWDYANCLIANTRHVRAIEEQDGKRFTIGYGPLRDRTSSRRSRDGWQVPEGVAAAAPAGVVGESAPPADPFARLPRSPLLPPLPDGFGAASSSLDVLCSREAGKKVHSLDNAGIMHAR